MSTQGSIATGARLKVVQPGEGRAGGLAPGVGVVFKIDGEDTGGALSIVEHPFAVGALVPPHIHTLEDEYSIVLEGEIGFRSEDQEVVLGAGGYIIKPRGEVHAMWNAGIDAGAHDRGHLARPASSDSSGSSSRCRRRAGRAGRRSPASASATGCRSPSRTGCRTSSRATT